MKKIWIFLLFIGVFSFVGFSFVVPKEAASMVKKHRQLLALLRQEKELPNVSAVFSSKAGEIELLSKAFPKKDELVSVAQTLESMSAQTGVLATIHFEVEDISEDSYGDAIIPISITAQGEYTDMMSFLERLTKGRYLFTFSTTEGISENGIKKINTLTLKGLLYASKDRY